MTELMSGSAQRESGERLLFTYPDLGVGPMGLSFCQMGLSDGGS